ncbi:MAG: hypothetical protein OXC41_04810 [Gammaproteobacteria bacterium]|nr:hypothetical protein [Gammaproteobacteria bacterium]
MNKEPDGLPSKDPFFELGCDRKWNALIGKQGDEENYIDGYIEAAITLASAVIDNQMMLSRDTLVLPILYTSRHALELALKFSINKLHEMGVVEEHHNLSHDIYSHWVHLRNCAIGDEAIRNLLAELETYVTSLDRVDKNGQGFRYSEMLPSDRSLAKLSLANLYQIRSSLKAMRKILENLRNRVLELADERKTDSHTRECSRNDIKNIANLLGNHSNWCRDCFIQAKQAVMDRYSISSTKFSTAVTKIRNSRGLSSLVGLEKDLTYLSDEDVIFVVNSWAKLHSAYAPCKNKSVTEHSGRTQPISNYIELAMETSLIEQEVIKDLLNRLTLEKVSDLEVLYYIGRDRLYGEFYDNLLGTKVESYRKENRVVEAVDGLMTKTNFLESLIQGCKAVGRPNLSFKLIQLHTSEPIT